jgi:hypothetical protein
VIRFAAQSDWELPTATVQGRCAQTQVVLPHRKVGRVYSAIVVKIP